MTEQKTEALAADHSTSHVTPLWQLLGAGGLLLFLTVVTVAAVRVDLGAFNIWIAMGIATVKGLVVALIFMHLLHDRPFYSFIFLTALVFVFLFIGISMMDTSQYNPERIPNFAPGMRR